MTKSTLESKKLVTVTANKFALVFAGVLGLIFVAASLAGIAWFIYASLTKLVGASLPQPFIGLVPVTGVIAFYILSKKYPYKVTIGNNILTVYTLRGKQGIILSKIDNVQSVQVSGGLKQGLATNALKCSDSTGNSLILALFNFPVMARKQLYEPLRASFEESGVEVDADAQRVWDLWFESIEGRNEQFKRPS